RRIAAEPAGRGRRSGQTGTGRRAAATARGRRRKAAMNTGNIWILVKAAASSWVDDYAPSMGAALAYYTLFSIAPLLIIAIAVAGLIFGQEAARGEIVAQIQGLIGREGAIAVQGLLKSANE